MIKINWSNGAEAVSLGDLLADFIGELWTYQKLKELATGITGKVAGYVKSAE